jgi:hypothetical protein
MCAGNVESSHGIPDCYVLRCEGKVIGGSGADLWKIRNTALQYPRATVAAGTVHAEKVERGS